VLEFVAGELHRTPLLLVVTVRPLDPDAPAALVDCLAELARQGDATRVDLVGLPAEAVGDWVARRSGAADPHAAQNVHARTGGNPFFVREVLALLDAEP
jgi:hypothetical protein